MRSTKNGWPPCAKGLNTSVAPFFDKKLELSLAHGLLYWGRRVVLPMEARRRILYLLHETHQGSSAMKAVARSSFWWPGLDHEWPLSLPEATVYARNFGRGEKWTPGIVESTTGSRMVSIRTPAGSVRRHVDQVRDREDATPPFGKDQEAAKRDSRTGTHSDYPLLPRTPAEQGGITEPEHELQPELAGSNAEPVRSPQALRRSTRQRKPVERLHY
ncbi:uncharacterized protein LOC144097596 [Amblyomma americanum]